jgi:UDP-N-acetylglucosamine transferase subunit ALG13
MERVPSHHPSAALVLVTVGTDYHPFDRLVGWIDRWEPPAPVRVVVQYGTAVAPHTADGAAFLAPDELATLLDAADAVVCAGGPGAIMEARAAGLRPIVVPRRASLGEHVDDHQRAFAEFMSGRDLVTLADDEVALHRALDAVAREPRTFRIARSDGAGDGVARISVLIDDLVNGAA